MKLQRIVKVMEFVMFQEIVYAMIIGIQKQIALVCSKLYLDLSEIVSLKKCLAQSFCVEMMVIVMARGLV